MLRQCGSLALMWMAALTVPVQAQTKAALVSGRVIWKDSPRFTGSDVVRFKDHWLAVYVDTVDPNSDPGALRVIRSQDGKTWESVALLKSETPGRGVSRPAFSVSPDGLLMVSARGVVPNPRAAEPVPRYGGTLNTMAWASTNGVRWSRPQQIGRRNFPFGPVKWNGGAAFSYGAGCICGSAQTIRIFRSSDGTKFQSIFDETFRGFFPEAGTLAFRGDEGFCLMSRSNGMVADEGCQTAFLGTSTAPFDDWKWRAVNARLKHPRLMRLPDNRLIGVAGVLNERKRTVLFELNAETGRLTELLTLPTGGRIMQAGLHWHDQHLWVSYQAVHDGAMALHLAKVQVD